jgi:uncharacterized membrane protein
MQPIKSGNRRILAFSIVALAFLVGLLFYKEMPQKMASHWNASGEVDGYIARFWGVFFVPIITLGLVLLLIFIPKIDPHRKNIERFRKEYDWLIVVFAGFMLYIHLLTLLWNLDFEFNMIFMLVPAFSFLFYFIGNLMGKTKKNWFIGIKTPWTLSSDKVWNKTHKLGGRLFKISALLALIGIFFGSYAIWFILIPITASSFYAVVFSYFEYKKLNRK